MVFPQLIYDVSKGDSHLMSNNFSYFRICIISVRKLLFSAVRRQTQATLCICSKGKYTGTLKRIFSPNCRVSSEQHIEVNFEKKRLSFYHFILNNPCTFRLNTISSKIKIPPTFHLNTISSKTNLSNYHFV